MKYLDDQESFNSIIENMDGRWKNLYKDYKSLALESAFPGRKLIVYTLKDGVPADITILEFGAMVVTPEDGPMVDVSSNEWSTVITVEPTKWRDRDFFLHMPQNFELKWKGKPTYSGKIQYASHYAILIKTKSADHLQIEGDTYCIAMNRFKEKFPNVSLKEYKKI